MATDDNDPVVDEMIDTLMDKGSPGQPKIPALRLFRVEKHAPDEAVYAHTYSIESGALNFYELRLIPFPGPYGTRAFAPGQWLGVQEVVAHEANGAVN